MIRGVLSALSTRITSNLILTTNRHAAVNPISRLLINHQNANFTSTTPAVLNIIQCSCKSISKSSTSTLLQPRQILSEQIRTVTKFSLQKGKRKSVRAVRQRFFRLHWGAWIHTIAGRHRKLWRKSARRRNRYLKHVFCNSTQNKMLDKMVNKFWRKPKYYIDDPYAPYHKRENFYVTQTKPWRPEGVDYE